MEKKVDRRIRKTKSQLRNGLAKLLHEKSIHEITVKELVEEVDINRSTFYLHYSDIYQMMESIEQELMQEIADAFQLHPGVAKTEDTLPFIRTIFSIIGEHKEVYSALIGTHGDMAFIYEMEKFMAENCLVMKKRYKKEHKENLEYIYAFCLAGCVGLVKSWIHGERTETPEEMADLTNEIVTAILK